MQIIRRPVMTVTTEMTGEQFADLLRTNRAVACDYIREQGFDELANRIISTRGSYWISYARAGTGFCDYQDRQTTEDYSLPDPINTRDEWFQMARFVEGLKYDQDTSD